MRFIMIDDDGKTEHVSVEDVVIAFSYYTRGLISFPSSDVAEEILARAQKRAKGIPESIKKFAAMRAEIEAAAEASD